MNHDLLEKVKEKEKEKEREGRATSEKNFIHIQKLNQIQRKRPKMDYSYIKKGKPTLHVSCRKKLDLWKNG